MMLVLLKSFLNRALQMNLSIRNKLLMLNILFIDRLLRFVDYTWLLVNLIPVLCFSGHKIKY